MLDELSSRGMTDAGPAALLDDEEDDTPDVYGRLGAAEGAAGLPGTGKKKVGPRSICLWFLAWHLRTLFSSHAMPSMPTLVSSDT